MESLRLTTWRHRRSGIRWARLSGTFTVFCGMGNSHTIEVDERDWETRDDVDDEAARLLEFALEDWTDPCDELVEAIESGDVMVDPDWIRPDASVTGSRTSSAIAAYHRDW
jgi:hypothetical protein